MQLTPEYEYTRNFQKKSKKYFSVTSGPIVFNFPTYK